MGWSNSGWLSDQGGWYKNAVAAAATSTWNPVDKEASIALTNGNLTATNGGGFGYHTIRATSSSSSTNKYFEITINVTGNSVATVGIANSTESLNGNAVGDTTNSVGWHF